MNLLKFGESFISAGRAFKAAPRFYANPEPSPGAGRLMQAAQAAGKV